MGQKGVSKRRNNHILRSLFTSCLLNANFLVRVRVRSVHNGINRAFKSISRIILDAPFQAITLPLFLELGWLPINHLCIARRLCLFKNILDGRAPDYLIQKLSSFKFNKLYDTRSRLPYRLPIPRTNSMKRMFFYNSVKLRNVVTSNIDFVCFSCVKKFRRSYFDLIVRKFTPDTFRIDRVF